MQLSRWSFWASLSSAVFGLLIPAVATGQTPELSEGVPEEAFLGEEFCFDTNFSNQGDEGYGPYFRLILPPELEFQSAEIFGSSIGGGVEDLGTFPASGELTDTRIDETVTGEEGFSYRNIVLPVGSVVDGGPDLEATICATIGEEAIVGEPLPVDLTPIYEFGDTPTGDNGPIDGDVVEQTVTPTVILFDKTQDAPESERPPGPSWPITYTLNVDIANTATMNPVTISDELPADLQYIENTAQITGGEDCTITQEPSGSTPGGEFEIQCDGDTVGTPAADDIVVTYEAYITDILDAQQCQIENLENTASVEATYVDQLGEDNPLPQIVDSSNVRAEHVAIQKSASGAQVPGEEVTYTLNLQVTDFDGAVNALVITDEIADGIDFEADSVSFTVDGGSPISVTPDVTVPNAEDGTTIVMDLFDGTGLSEIAESSGVTVTYTGTVRQTYRETGEPVRASDSILNSVSMEHDLVAGATSCNEGSAASVSILPIDTNKKIVNEQDAYAPGDTLVYRLTMEVPSGDTRDIVFTDFLPLPVLKADDVIEVFSTDPADCDGASSPSAGVCLAPTAELDSDYETLLGETGEVEVTTLPGQNAIEIRFPDVDTEAQQTLAVDLYTTVTDDPFADGLFLTNILQVETANTPGETTTETGPVAFDVRAPVLDIDKAITTTGGEGSISGDGNLAGADAGDTVEYTITLTNTGGAPAFDVTVTDPPPSGLESCSDASVEVDGSTRSFTGSLDTGGGLLIDGEVDAGQSAAITYTCTLADDVTPRQELDNEAEATWASQEGAPPFPAIRDDANVTVASPGLAKTSIAVDPQPSADGVVPGDVVTYQLTVDLPEGEIPDLVIEDELPAGFAYVPDSVAVENVGSGVTLDNDPPLVDDTIPQNPAFDFGAASVTATQGTANNTFVVTYDATVLDDPANAAPDSEQARQNTATLSFGGEGAGSVSDNHTVQFREPVLAITKSFDPDEDLVAGQQVTITLELENTGTAPAFDLFIEDVLNNGAGGVINDLLDLGTVIEDTTPAGFDFGYNSGTGVLNYTTADPATSLAPGDSLEFTFTATVLDDVVTGSEYSNTVTAEGFSQPDAAIDERRRTEAEDTATVNVADATVAKTLVDTSETFTTGTDVAIGETFTYDIQFDLPPGVTQAVTIADVITNGFDGVSLVGATLARSSEDLDSDVNPSGINGQDPNDDAVAVVLVEDGNALVLDLGDVTNGSLEDETYTLSVTLRVDNVAANTQDRGLRDRGRIYFEDVEGTERNVQSGELTVNVVLPAVDVDKSVSPSSPAAGDTVTYTLIIANLGNATGFDWTFEDELPDLLENPTITDDGGTDAAFTDNTLSGAIDELAPDAVIEITYQATIAQDTPFLTAITNDAGATTTSLPSGSDNEDDQRTGDGGVNNLFGNDTASLTTSSPTLSKTLIDGQDRYSIGDIVHYRIEMGVPVGTTDEFVIVDDLPEGLTFLDQEPNEASLDLDGVSSDGTGLSFNEGDNRLEVDLGEVTAAEASTVTVDYYMQVDNVAGNQNDVVLANEAVASFEDPEDPSQTVNLGPESVSITVGEPELNVTKSIPSGGVNLQAGDEVDWRIEFENTGNTTAWQTELVDILPDGAGTLDPGAITVSIQAGDIRNADGDLVSDDDVQIQATNVDDDTFVLEGLEVPAGAVLRVDFTTRLADDVIFGDTLINEAIATFASQPDGNSEDDRVRDAADAPDGLNDYQASGSTSLTIASDLEIDKTVDRNEATIGEEVTFTIRLSLITGVTENVFVSDTLPDGLAYVSHNISVGHMGIAFGNPDYADRLGSGQEVDFDLGNISNPPSNGNNDNFVDIEVTARVENTEDNQNGDVLSNGEDGTVWVEYGDDSANPVRLEFDADPADEDTISGIPVDIVEPVLDVSKTVAPGEQALGNEVVFTVNLEHASGSSADGFDLSIVDQLPPGLTYVEGSASLPADAVNVDGQDLEFAFSTLELGEDREFVYRAAVSSAAVVGSEQTNALGMTWSSLPDSTGEADSGRTGADGPDGEPNNYARDDDATVTVTADAFLYPVKTVALFDDVAGNGQVDPGDTLEYTVVLENQGPDASGVVFTDPLPANTEYVHGSLTTTQGTPDDSNDPLVVDVGDLDGGGSVTITFQVVVDAPLPSGVIISNQGSVDSDQTVPTPTDADGIPENGFQPTDVPVGGASGDTPGASLQFTKNYALTDDVVAPTGTINEGDEVTYTFVISNTGQEALTNVVFTDTVPVGPPGMDVTGITTTQGTAPAASNNVVIDDIGTIAPGDSVVISIIGTANGDGDVLNQATVSSDQVEDTLSDGDGTPDTDPNPTVFPVEPAGETGEPALALDKQVQLIDDANSDGRVNPGETVRFTLRIRNTGSAVAEDVRLTDDLTDLIGTLLPGSVQVSQGSVVTLNPELEVNVGALDPGASATVSFLVVADEPGDLRNQAEVRDADGNITEDSASIPVVVFEPFDPPSGLKLVNDEGVPELEWTMVWLNPNDTYVSPLRVVDPIPANSSFVEDSLECIANGVSETTSCEFDPVAGEVVFEGFIGPDPGAVDETDSDNAVIIVFRVEIESLNRSVSNQATAQWDEDGSGSVDPNQVPVTSSTAQWEPEARPVPVLSPVGLLLLGVLFLVVLRLNARLVPLHS
ncbi:isopeptide-forming domain-containing fimbrial protein [Thioalkalivibrio sp. ALE11]|uniref:isopeptide-forming domain-containing fimbrial protein n=1 Tax=Thioalkalivibrio sp. ALE11 TaxID=1265494 RepID=UPI0003A5F3CC|nr:isopeptide-forming domain-containing fimbrial protein [Thioalkalivibrio sp. ALE11]